MKHMKESEFIFQMCMWVRGDVWGCVRVLGSCILGMCENVYVSKRSQHLCVH